MNHTIKINFQLIFFLKQFVFAKLNFECINDTISSLKVSSETESELLRSTIINPVFGYFFTSTGALDNLRCYSPGIEIKKLQNNTRDFYSDYSADPITQMLIEMFPSPTNTFFFENNENSFRFKFNENRKEGIEFLAIAFSKILTSKDNFLNFLPHEYNTFEVMKQLLMNSHTTLNFFEPNQAKLLAIHAFILNVLDDEKDLKEYLEIILKNIENKNSIEIYNFGVDVLNCIKDSKQQLKSFSFSEYNQPIPSQILPLYFIKLEDNVEKEVFLNSAEILLLNICNCLFYDPNTCRYSIQHLQQDSKLANFYKKHNQRFEITDEVKSDWSKVVHRLEDFKGKENDIKMINKISYLTEKRDSLRCGLITMMNVLIKICNINHSEFWKDFCCENISEKIVKLFKLIYPNFQGQTISFNLNTSAFDVFNFDENFDFQGSFELQLKQENGNSIILSISQSCCIAEMKLIKCIRHELNHRLAKEINSKPKALPVILFRNYLELSKENKIGNHDLDIFFEIFFSGPLNTINQEQNILLHISKALLKEENRKGIRLSNDEIKMLKMILNSFISTKNLNNMEIKASYALFLYNCDWLNPNFIINCWEKSFSFEACDIYKLWEEKIINLNFESISLNFHEIPVHKIPELFKILKKCKNLKDLTILKMKFEQFELFSSCLKELTNLKTLNLSNNGLGYKGAVSLSEAFKELTNLTSLNLSGNCLAFRAAQAIAKGLVKLENLTDLDISDNGLGCGGSKFIAEALIYLQKLHTLNISKNNCGIEGTAYILDSLINCLNLSELNLSRNIFSRQGVQNFSQSLSLLTTLTRLNISENFFNDEDIWNISNALCNLTQLTHLNLSKNRISGGNAEYISFSLQNLQHLTVLNLSGNLLRQKGAFYISKTFSGLNSLKVLDLSNNFIEEEGALEIAKELEYLTNLEILNISRNFLGVEGIQYIKDSLANLDIEVKLVLSNEH